MSTQNTAVATLPQRASLVTKFAAKFSIEPEKLLTTLKATAFKVKDGEVTNEQMAALLIVADQYDLNPFTREIFAFPDKQNGIVPVVSVDGWARIINEHPQMDGLEFHYSPETIAPGDERFPGLKWTAFEWIESVIYRKDRTKPIVVREFFEEVYRKPFEKGNYVIESAWQTHSKRFHRHKALIQGGRLAFGFAGIYDPDEAERIIEGEAIPEVTVRPPRGAAGLKAALVGKDAATVDTVKAASTEGSQPAHGKSESPSAAAAEPKSKPAGTAAQRGAFIRKFGDCKDAEILGLVMDETREFEWSDADREALDCAYSKRQDELEAK